MVILQRIISMLDYLVNAQNAIVTGINFYIFAVIIALGTILLTDNDYSYNTIIKIWEEINCIIDR